MQTITRVRPSRAEIEPAALDLIQRHGAQIMSTARRYSVTAEDAEDAYQRGLEILLTKAPSTSHEDLVPWLKTVVKHEAFAVRKQRRRHIPVSALGDEEDEPAEPVAPSSTDEEAEHHERLRLGAEALGRLKPQEVRALLLKAEGLSYKEIQAETGWTYTKVCGWV
jgi:RNA polymerase sigma factor (sigma-70 family)